MTQLVSAPEGFVEVLRGVPREAGLVVEAMLESYGIRTAMVGATLGLEFETRTPGHVVSIHVPADRADEARGLLTEGLEE